MRFNNLRSRKKANIRVRVCVAIDEEISRSWMKLMLAITDPDIYLRGIGI